MLFSMLLNMIPNGVSAGTDTLKCELTYCVPNQRNYPQEGCKVQTSTYRTSKSDAGHGRILFNPLSWPCDLGDYYVDIYASPSNVITYYTDIEPEVSIYTALGHTRIGPGGFYPQGRSYFSANKAGATLDLSWLISKTCKVSTFGIPYPNPTPTLKCTLLEPVVY